MLWSIVENILLSLDKNILKPANFHADPVGVRSQQFLLFSGPLRLVCLIFFLRWRSIKPYRLIDMGCATIAYSGSLTQVTQLLRCIFLSFLFVWRAMEEKVLLSQPCMVVVLPSSLPSLRLWGGGTAFVLIFWSLSCLTGNWFVIDLRHPERAEN